MSDMLNLVAEDKCRQFSLCEDSSLGGLKCEFLTSVNDAAAAEYLTARVNCKHYANIANGFGRAKK